MSLNCPTQKTISKEYIMTKYAIKVTTDNKIDIVEFDSSNSYNLIKEAVGGGLFQCIYLPKLNVDLWIDDEGKLVNEPIINAFGSALWVGSYGMTDYIVGDIIVTGGNDGDGKTLGLTEEQTVAVLKSANDTMRLAVGNAFEESNITIAVE
jgi:hypothetical protein